MLKFDILKFRPTGRIDVQLVRKLSTNSKVNDSNLKLIFVAPNQRAVRLLKKFSISTSILSLIALPTFHYASVYSWFVVDQFSLGLASLALLGSFTSTGFMHWFCSPYVTQLYLNTATTTTPSKNEKETEPSYLLTPDTELKLITTSLLGKQVETDVKLNQLVMGKLPHVTWRINSNLLASWRHQSLEQQNQKLNLPKFSRTKFWIDMPQSYKYEGRQTVMQVNDFIYQLSR